MLCGAARLGIGTVQFGLDYGVTNRAGKVSVDEAAAILRFAHGSGITTLDTAALYGDSEATIGRAARGVAFDIVTKTPKVSAEASAEIAAEIIVSRFEKSIGDLRVDRVHALMVHDAGDLLGAYGDTVWKSLEAIRSSGRARKIGASVYSGEDIDRLLARYDVDIVQLPINGLDSRLVDGGQMEALAMRGVEVHARSIFLQGLLLMPPEQLPAKFATLAPALIQMRQAFTKAGLSLIEGLVAAVFRHRTIDRVIVGAASLGEFQEIVSAADRLKSAEIDSMSWRWPEVDQRFLNPALWGAL